MRHLLQSQAWWFCFLAIVAAPTTISAAPPSSVYPDDSDTAESLIRSAQANVRDEQWTEAADIYRSAMETYGDKAIRVPDAFRTDKDFVEESRRWVNLREFVLAQLADWPEAGRTAFAQRTDTEAGRIWNRAIAADADPSQAQADLIKLSRDFFLGSYGARAIERLGDLAFQNGEFDAAALWYARLAVSPDTPQIEGVKPVPAIHPNPATDKALLTAKLVLARIAAGLVASDHASELLKSYAAAFPEAKGTFAGRNGLYSQSLAQAVKDDGLAPTDLRSTDWPTFAGSPTRNLVVEDSIDLGDRQWRAAIDSVVQGPARFQGQNRFGGFGGRGVFPRNFPANPNRTSAQLLLAYHPVIVGEQVIICTDYRVQAYNLNEAPKDEPIRADWTQEFDRIGRNNPQQMMSSSAPRMTLTAHGGRLFARMGESGINLEFGNRMAPSNAFIVAMDIRNKGAVLWRLQGSQIELAQPDGAAAPAVGSIEGTPVADDERLYLAVTLPGHQTSTYIVALEAETGKPVWSRYVCDTPNPFDFQAAMLGYQASHAHHLLTLEGNRLFYQSDTGAVACLDAATGSLRWLTAYPKREQLGNAAIPPTRRDLNPVIYDDGVVYVAPSDSQNLFALDAETGAIKWKSAPLPDLIHLIGVAEGNLFATGDRVWTVDTATGRILRSWPDTGSGYEPAGRGLMAGRYLYWPTATEIHILDQKTGLRSDRGTIRLKERFNTSGGNLVLGDGFLVVAGTESLSAFTQNTRLIRRYEQLIAAEPNAAGPRYRLATAAESLGDNELAIASLREALKRVAPQDRLDGQDLERLVRDRLFRLLLKAATVSDDKPGAVKSLAEAESIAPDAVKRLAAVIQRANLLIELGEPRKALDELSEATRRPETLNGLWSVESRWDVNISDLASRTILQAWSQLTPADKSAFAAAEAQAFAELGEADRESLVAFTAACVPGETKARALIKLARLDEAAEDPILARHRLDESAAQPGSPPLLAREIAAARTGFASKSVAISETRPDWPLTKWIADFRNVRQIIPVIDPEIAPDASQFAGMMILGIAKDNSTFLIDPQSGRAGPVLDELAAPPIWAGLNSGRGLIFDGTALWGIDPNTGRTVWRVSLREINPFDPRYSPFVSARSAEASTPPNTEKRPTESSSAGQDRSWWIVKAHQGGVVLFDISGQFWRVDVMDGRLLWRRSTDSVQSPEYAHAPIAHQVGSRVIVRNGSSILILDEATGALQRSIASEVAGSDWSRDPLTWDADRIIICPDRLSVAMIDLARGERLWTYKATSTQPRNGPPRVIRHGDKLVVIKDGDMAVRLGPEDGRPVWEVFLGGVDHSRDLPDIAVDESRLYIIEPLDSSRIPGVVSRAIDLTDGSNQWKSVHIGAGQSWAVTALVGKQSGVLIRPENGVTRYFADGLVQEGETFSITPASTIGEAVHASAVLLDRSTGRAVRRYASPVRTMTPWVVADKSASRLFWGSFREPSAALVTREH